MRCVTLGAAGGKMGNKGFLKIFGVVLATSVFASCGGASFGDTTGSGGGTGGGGSTGTPASVKLIASAPQLLSSASTTVSAGAVTLTAIVKDSGNNLLTGIPVTFTSAKSTNETCMTAGGGALTPGGSTNATGTVQSILTTAGKQTNGVITVKAKVGSLTDSLDIPVTGTNLQISGSDTVGATGATDYSIQLLDSSGVGIGNEVVTVTSSLSNTVTSSSFTTNSAGIIVVHYTGTHSGADLLSVSAACATSQKAIQVSSQTLTFSSPATNTEIKFGTSQSLTVKLAPAVAGTTINFTTTRGILSASSAVTAADGTATVNISQIAGSNGAGGALVSATVQGSNVSASLPVEFVATTPTSVKLQSTPTTVPVNQSATISAVVRDADNNLVKNQRVNFKFATTAVGSIASPGFAVTNSEGLASVTYTASSTSSAKDGVKITGEVVDGSNIPVPGVSDTVALTVGGQALRIVLGTGNTVDTSGGSTIYRLPYSVLVTDSSGNPPPVGTQVTVLVDSIAYQKGVEVFSGGIWTPVYYINSASRQPDPTGFGCLNEDKNRNGILDVAANEDFNGNGNLEPGNVASVPATITTDATGYSAFVITYPRDHAYWVQVRLTVSVTVAGTENLESQTFVLPGVASDFNSSSTAPPGQISPYGTAASCAESLPGPFVSFDLASQTVAAAGQATVKVNLSRTSTSNVVVPFTFAGGLLRGPDYTTSGLSPADTLTITAGSTTASFIVNTVNTGSFTVNIGDPTNAEQGGTSVQTVTVQ